MFYFRAKSFEKSDAYKKAYTPGSKDQVVTKQPGKNSHVHLSAIFGNYIKILIHRFRLLFVSGHFLKRSFHVCCKYLQLHFWNTVCPHNIHPPPRIVSKLIVSVCHKYSRRI